MRRYILFNLAYENISYGDFKAVRKRVPDRLFNAAKNFDVFKKG